MVFIDTNVILDMWDRDPVWEQWSKAQVLKLLLIEEIVLNTIVFAELASRYNTAAKLEAAIQSFGFRLLDIPPEAAFLAGKAFVQYRRQGGTKAGVLPDFFIGAHAVVLGAPLLTRDARRYSTYFPTVQLITP